MAYFICLFITLSIECPVWEESYYHSPKVYICQYIMIDLMFLMLWTLNLTQLSPYFEFCIEAGVNLCRISYY